MYVRNADLSSRREALPEPKFLADSMHGKLARWLRMLGFDTVYCPEPDSSIIVRARDEGRIVLTSDTELHRRLIARCAHSIFLNLEGTEEQLSRIGLYLEQNFSIHRDEFLTPKFRFCSLCNGLLEQVSDFKWRCKNCSQEYWKGGHWRNISQTLERAKRLIVEVVKE